MKLLSHSSLCVAILSFMDSIGTRIKDARKRKKITQQELADELGLSVGAVSQWEQEATEPSIKNLEKLAVVLDTQFEWLATGRGVAGIEDYLVDITKMYRDDPRLVYLSEEQKEFFEAFSQLPTEWQKKATDLIKVLAVGLESKNYKKDE